MADTTARLCPSGVGLEAETSVDGDGEAVVTYSQSMLRREHRVQRGRVSSHFIWVNIPNAAAKIGLSDAYLDPPLLAG